MRCGCWSELTKARTPPPHPPSPGRGKYSRPPSYPRLGEPGAGLALGLGDLPRAHFLGDLGAAGLAFEAAVQGGEVEPFMRLDEVDLHAMGAGGISDAQLVERFRIAHRRVGEAAFEE